MLFKLFFSLMYNQIAMKYIAFSIVCLFIAAAGGTQAQTTNGKVLDKNTSKAIVYANIGLPGKNIGTTTNESGNYSLSITNADDNDSVKISMIGYLPQMFTVKQLRLHPDIYLQPRNNELREVIIKPKKFKQRVLGNTSTNKNINVGFGGYQLGNELGTLMKIKRRHTYIDSIRINISKCNSDSIFVRLNISESVDGQFINILSQPIYVSAATKDAMNKLVVDLTQYNLLVNHNFLVSIEMVRSMNKQLYLCGELLGSPTYVREVSQAPWTKIGIAGPAISAYVTY